MKLIWGQPKLIGLYREKEENVLAACKVSKSTGARSGPSRKNSRCYSKSNCASKCSTLATS